MATPLPEQGMAQEARRLGVQLIVIRDCVVQAELARRRRTSWVHAIAALTGLIVITALRQLETPSSPFCRAEPTRPRGAAGIIGAAFVILTICINVCVIVDWAAGAYRARGLRRIMEKLGRLSGYYAIVEAVPAAQIEDIVKLFEKELQEIQENLVALDWWNLTSLQSTALQ